MTQSCCSQSSPGLKFTDSLGNRRIDESFPERIFSCEEEIKKGLLWRGKN